MGQSRGGGYQKLPTITPEVKTLLDKLISSSGGNLDASAEGFMQFLPGGGGGEAIANAAQQRFQQQTVPSILNTFGQNVKGSSALNNALASGAANLNSDVASKLAEMQLAASQGIGNLGLQQAGLGAQTPQFAYTPKQTPPWMTILQSLISGGSQAGAAYLGAPRF